MARCPLHQVTTVYLWTIPELLSAGICTNLTNQEARFAVGTDCSATKGNLFKECARCKLKMAKAA